MAGQSPVPPEAQSPLYTDAQYLAVVEAVVEAAVAAAVAATAAYLWEPFISPLAMTGSVPALDILWAIEPSRC